MITEQDLQEAIAECIGERNPNANTCIKLAAFYTIKANLYPDDRESELPQRYSFAPDPSEPADQVRYDSGSEFSDAIQGMETNEVLSIMDELMTTIKAMIPRLFDGVLNRLKE